MFSSTFLLLLSCLVADMFGMPALKQLGTVYELCNCLYNNGCTLCYMLQGDAMAAPTEEAPLFRCWKTSPSTAGNAGGSSSFIPANITPATERYLKVGT